MIEDITKEQMAEAICGSIDLAQKIVSLAGLENKTTAQVCLAVIQVVESLKATSPKEWAAAENLFILIHAMKADTDANSK